MGGLSFRRPTPREAQRNLGSSFRFGFRLLCLRLPQGFTAQFDAGRVLYEAAEDAVGKWWHPDLFVPFPHGKLRGEDVERGDARERSTLCWSCGANVWRYTLALAEDFQRVGSGGRALPASAARADRAGSTECDSRYCGCDQVALSRNLQNALFKLALLFTL